MARQVSPGPWRGQASPQSTAPAPCIPTATTKVAWARVGQEAAVTGLTWGPTVDELGSNLALLFQGLGSHPPHPARPTGHQPRTWPPLRMGRGPGWLDQHPSPAPHFQQSSVPAAGSRAPDASFSPLADPTLTLAGSASPLSLVSSFISTVAPDDLPLMLVFMCEGPWWAARPKVLPWGTLSQC